MFINYTKRVIAVGIMITITTLTCVTTINLFDPHRYIRTYQDSALVPYLKNFKEEAAMRGIKLDERPISLLFSAPVLTSDTTVGECLSRPNEIIILIDRGHWDSIKEASREELMFHELAHGLLKRHLHCDNEVDGKRLSIMGAYVGDPNDYYSRRDQLISELFEADKRCKENK